MFKPVVIYITILQLDYLKVNTPETINRFLFQLVIGYLVYLSVFSRYVLDGPVDIIGK